MKQGKFKVEFQGTKYDCEYITDPARAETVIKKFDKNPSNCIFGIDTETAAFPVYRPYPFAALSPHLSTIRLVQLFDGKECAVFDIYGLKNLSILKSFLESRKFIGHYSTFDIKFFLKQGIRVNMGCTWIAAKLIQHAVYPTDTGLKASLDALSQQVFETDVLKKVQNSDWSVQDLTYEQIEYAARDAIVVRALAQKLAQGISKLNLKECYQRAKNAQIAIASMELTGIGVDVHKHREKVSIWREELFKSKKKLTKLTGLDHPTPAKVAKWLEKNLDEDTLSVWTRTEGGKLSTDAHTFADYSHLAIVKPFSEFQKKEKLTSSFGMNLINLVNPETKRIHASYNLMGARTGRMSSSKPNLQQLPRGADVRDQFVARPGYVFICADYSQIELRVAAEISKDTVMLKAYKDGLDLHTVTAANMLGKELKDVTKEDRQNAKPFNFGLMFGLGAKAHVHYSKKEYGKTTTLEEAKEDIKTWWNLYSGLKKWKEKQVQDSVKTLTASTPGGKVRKLSPENAFGASLNTPIQGGASECILEAVALIEGFFFRQKVDANLVNCVHDEILVECVKEHAEGAAQLVELGMVEGFRRIFPNASIKNLVEVGVGGTWTNAKG
jgi:DNA polymerase-1